MPGTTPQSAIDNWGERPAIVMPGVRITQAVLDAAKAGRGTLDEVRWVRGIFEAAGVSVEPHKVELNEISRLRSRAEDLMRQASLLEALIKGEPQ